MAEKTSKGMMAEDKQKDSKKTREKSRGTQDELQILALIVMENPYIKSMVMERMNEVVKRANRMQSSDAAGGAAAASPTSLGKERGTSKG